MATDEIVSAENQPATARGSWLLSLVKELRPRQWTKNAIVFAGLVFAKRLMDPTAIALATLAFLVFCLLSSAVYVINDLVDLKADRQHPRKRLRPLASGAITPTQGKVLVGLLLLATLPAAFMLDPIFGLVAVVYFVANLAYSLRLKHVVIVDVFIIAGGFVLRAIAGAVVVGAESSPWFLLCTTLAALFLALTKRRHELVLLSTNAGTHRPILAEYTTPLLEEMIAVVTSSTVVAYSLYTFFAPNLPDNHVMMLTIPFVLYAIFRYLYLVYRKDLTGSPEEALLKDMPMLVCIVVWGLASIAILYYPWPK